MNADFHYYGTYAAALSAGFSVSEAKQIAWAAQMVDDCTEEFLKQEKVPKNARVVTCETTGEMVWDDKDDLSDANHETLKKVRRIWMPFHFLPGNLDGRKRYTGKKDWGFSRYDEARDGDDFRCICLHNSDLAEKMIENTRVLCDADNPLGLTPADKLYLIGIRMHVLADTWAHEFFAGTPNFWVNEIEESGQTGGRPVKKEGAPDLISFYSMAYHGHAQIGHWPDYGYMSYEYRPRWLGEGAIKKNNPDIFFNAFCQMAAAMSYIRNHTPFALQEGLVPAANDFRIPFPDSDDAIHISGEEIYSVLKSENTDQTSDWEAFIRNKLKDLPEADAKYEAKDPRYDISQFCSNAGIHQAFVRYEVNKKGLANVTL